jgi:hypothetical protein
MGSYTRVRKRIVATEIAMYQSAGIVITGTIRFEPVTKVITAMKLLLLKVLVLEMLVFKERTLSILIIQIEFNNVLNRV